MRLAGRNLQGAVPLAAVGPFVAWGATEYPAGSLSRLGPGFLPTAYGLILVLLGVAIAFLPDDADLQPSDSGARDEFRSGLFVLLPVMLFGAAIVPLGVVPTSASTAFVASFADRHVRLRSRIALGAVVAALCTGIFTYALGMQIPLFGTWFAWA